jgi:hypothetical protein
MRTRAPKTTPYNKPLTCGYEAREVQQQFLVYSRTAIDRQRPAQTAIGLQHRWKLHDRDRVVKAGNHTKLPKRNLSDSVSKSM